jgi:F0F1-type ATP synthase membrane subunit b/b'
MNTRAEKVAKKLTRAQRRTRKLRKAMEDFERVIESPHENLSGLTDDVRRIQQVLDGIAEANLRAYRGDPFDYLRSCPPDEC